MVALPKITAAQQAVASVRDAVNAALDAMLVASGGETGRDYTDDERAVWRELMRAQHELPDVARALALAHRLATFLCTSCGASLEYRADFGAPGFGQAWDCPRCEHPHRVVGNTVHSLRDCDPTDLELDPEDER